jgi:hypothetical protein
LTSGCALAYRLMRFAEQLCKSILLESRSGRCARTEPARNSSILDLTWRDKKTTLQSVICAGPRDQHCTCKLPFPWGPAQSENSFASWPPLQRNAKLPVQTHGTRCDVLECACVAAAPRLSVRLSPLSRSTETLLSATQGDFCPSRPPRYWDPRIGEELALFSPAVPREKLLSLLCHSLSLLSLQAACALLVNCTLHFSPAGFAAPPAVRQTSNSERKAHETHRASPAPAELIRLL